MTARPTITVAGALRSDKLFAPFFAGSSWDRWRATLKAAFAEPLTTAERVLFREIAERDPPAHRVKELAAIVGRGGGKDSVASFIAAHIAMNFDPRAAKLRPGELAYVMCVAVDRDQAGIVYKYIRAYFEENRTLRALVRDIGSDSIELCNRVVIQVVANSYRSVRGRSILCTIFDEVAFWRDDRSANPDTEVHAAITPGLSRVAGSMLILISSAHRRSGLLYERWKHFFGKNDDDVLVVRGTTTQFNPTFDQALIDKHLLLDPQRYSAEYNSEWRDDLATFLSRELLDASVDRHVSVRPPIDVSYCAFCDPSGGMSDAFTASIAHREQRQGETRVVIDLIYERRPPFNPTEVIDEISRLLKTYRVSEVRGDRYAAAFVTEAFRKCGIEYLHSRLDRSEIYLDFLPLVTAGQLLLLDHPRAIAQFAALERRTYPSGKDKIDHPLNGHDDIANSVAGAAVLAAQHDDAVPLASPVIITRSDLPSPPTHRSSTQLFYDHYANGGASWWGPVGGDPP